MVRVRVRVRVRVGELALGERYLASTPCSALRWWLVKTCRHSSIWRSLSLRGQAKLVSLPKEASRLRGWLGCGHGRGVALGSCAGG